MFLSLVMMRSSPYGWLLLAGIVVSIAIWARIVRRDERLLLVYVGGLLGAFLGAKLAYLLVEGWMHFGAPDMWLQLATGKSILGALPGGYVGVELAKHWLGYRGVTGDKFAMIAPVGIIFGRIGCWMHGCCLGTFCRPSWYTLNDTTGIARWPSVPVEILFNLAALATFFVLRRRRLLLAQHFHLYLMGYGVFRFIHEFVRDTPRIGGIVSGYQVAALAVFAFGLVRFLQRQNHPQPMRECDAGEGALIT